MPAQDPAVVTIKVPFAVRKRGGHKLVLTPDGASVRGIAGQQYPSQGNRLRLPRWQKMLETRQYATIKEIAKAEKINPFNVSRVLRLTLLDSALVEGIVNGHQRSDASLDEFLRPFSPWWPQVEGMRSLHRIGPTIGKALTPVAALVWCAAPAGGAAGDQAPHNRPPSTAMSAPVT